MTLKILILFLAPALPGWALTETAQEAGNTAKVQVREQISSTAEMDWKNAIEDLAPGSNPWKDKNWTPGFFTGHGVLSTNYAIDSQGGSYLSALAGVEVSPNLSLFTMTQGGLLSLRDANGFRRCVNLPALSTLGLDYGGLKLAGWDWGLNASVTPGLAGQGYSAINTEALRYGWGGRDAFGLGTTLSRDWGGGFKTLLSVRINQPAPLAPADDFGWMNR